MTTATLNGLLKITVKGKEALPSWLQKIQREALAKGAPEALRYQCQIAKDVRDSLGDGFETSDGTKWLLIPSAKPQFGRDQHDRAYLTISIMQADNPDIRYTVRWLGDAVPTRMLDISVAHDDGRKVPTVRLGLALKKAEITPIKKDTRGRKDGGTEERKARWHATRDRKTARITATDLRDIKARKAS